MAKSLNNYLIMVLHTETPFVIANYRKETGI